MSLDYGLTPNNFSNLSNTYFASIARKKAVEFPEVLKILTRRGLTTTDTEIESVINELIHTINELLNKGETVHTPFANYRLSIKGIFHHPDERFDDEKHSVKLSCYPGKEVHINDKHIELKKIQLIPNYPKIIEFTDFASQTINQTGTAGGTAEIKGLFLKLKPDDMEQGIFFIASDSSISRADAYFKIKPSGILFNIPQSLTAGDYILEIRTRLKENSTSVRKYKFEETLHIL